MSPFTSLRITVPLVLLVFAAVLSTGNWLYHVPQAERVAEEDSRKRLTQELSRLQSTLEYLTLKGDAAAAKHEIEVLAHNHDVIVAALTDDRDQVVTATRRTWLGRRIAELLPEFELTQAASAIRQRRAGMSLGPEGNSLLGYAGVLLAGDNDELRPSRTGSLYLVYDLERYKAEARTQVVKQSLYWAGWVTALALAMWLVLHVLLTRRTALLVHAAEQLAAGNLAVRSGLRGADELGRLGRAFDAMALEVAETQTRLRHDIAERARVQRELEASETSYRAMFNASIDGLALWNAAGEVVDTNPALRHMYGYADAEFLDCPPDSWQGLSYPPSFLRTVAAGHSMHSELTVQRKDGVSMELEIHGIPMQYQGEPHILTIARDISEKKRSEAELARQRETSHQREKLAALGSLLAGVAHELNNPLSVVVARAVLLEERGNPATQTAAAKIRTAAERCARIVRTFLAMARQQQPQRGPVAMNDVILAALDIAGYALRTASINVQLDLAPDIPLVDADADQLHQVLLNLLINAQQSLREQGLPRRIVVTSRLDARADRLLVTVADNGPGIPAHLRARVFEPYFTTKPVGVGTGVGLAVSLGIVEAHGGTITVNEAPAGGAAFVIALPVGAVPAIGSDAVPAAASPAQGHAVLIVDDEAEIRETLAEILAGPQHRVVAVASAREALQRMAVERYDVIFTDIRMPGLDGRALYRKIEERWPELAERVVFVTGDTLTAGLRDFVSETGRRVVEKPFLPSDVRRVMAELMVD